MSAAQLTVHYDRGGDRPRCGTGNRTTGNLLHVDCLRCIQLTLLTGAP